MVTGISLMVVTQDSKIPFGLSKVQRLHSGIVKHTAKMETVPAEQNGNVNCVKCPLEGGWGELCAGALCWIKAGRLCSHCDGVSCLAVSCAVQGWLRAPAVPGWLL